MKRLILAILIIAIALFSSAEEKNVKVMINEDGCVNCEDGEWEGIKDLTLPGTAFGANFIPNLSDEQEKDIQKIEFDLQKNLIDLDASVKKAEIDLKELILEDAKLDKLNKKIDEMGKIKTDIDKKKMEAFLKVREKLDKEQKEFINEMGLDFFGFGGPLKMIKKMIKIDDDNLIEKK